MSLESDLHTAALAFTGPAAVQLELNRIVDTADACAAYGRQFLQQCATLPADDFHWVRQALRQRFTAKDFSLREWDRRIKEARIELTARERGESGCSGSGKDLLGYMLNDKGNCDRVLALYKDRLRYCYAWKKWLVWDGKRWSVDQSGEAKKLAEKALLRFFEQAAAAGHDKEKEFARRSLEDKRINSTLASLEKHAAISVEELDSHPFLVNFENGTFDIESGELREHRREDLITKIIHHKYNSSAAAPRFLEFLNRAMAQRATLVEFLRLAVGYSLTGSTREKCVFFLYGSGDNGKSVFLSTIRELIREYSGLLFIETLMTRQEDNATRSDLADLCGARMVQTTETEEGQRLSEGKLKRITQGMGRIKGMRKYENGFEFDETHKLWLDCNHMPASSASPSTMNRLRIVPWDVVIPKAEQDPDLRLLLLAEAEGILAWAIGGAVDWHRTRLPTPDEVNQAAAAYQQQQDHLADWLEACCVIGEECKISAKTLFDSYRRFAADTRQQKILDIKHFKDAMIRRDFEQRRNDSGVFWIGLELQTLFQ